MRLTTLYSFEVRFTEAEILAARAEMALIRR
jgi:hypothetical protein